MEIKVKVYLGEKQEPQLLNGAPMVVALTRWTYAMATGTKPTQVVIGERLLEMPTYTGTSYVDGSAWTLSETDACVDKRFAPMNEPYKVFCRPCAALPAYSLPNALKNSGLPFHESFTPEQVREFFPLAVTFGGAVINQAEYYLTTKKGLTRRFVNGRHPTIGQDIEIDSEV